MKKILAMAMAIVMMMAIAVPAFATKTLDTATNEGDTTVIVDGTNGGLYDGAYTVTIPAQIELSWGQTSASYDYEITSQLATNKRVSVALAKSKDLTNANNETIAFTAADATDGISDAPVVTDEAHAFNLAIEAAAWTTVSLAEYTGTITFTSEIVDA